MRVSLVHITSPDPHPRRRVQVLLEATRVLIFMPAEEKAAAGGTRICAAENSTFLRTGNGFQKLTKTILSWPLG